MTSFAAVVNCMDGRTQLPVNEWMRKYAGVDAVDTITEPGPDGILAQEAHPLHASIRARLDISVTKHGARVIAVVGHADCAGHPVDESRHRADIQRSVERIKAWFPGVEVVGLWVGNTWQVERVV